MEEPPPPPIRKPSQRDSGATAVTIAEAADALGPFLLDLGNPDEPIRDRLRRALSAVGPEFQHLNQLEEGVMQLLLDELERHRAELESKLQAPASTAAPSALDEGAASLYERRISKLTSALDEARESIQRLAKLKNVDLGLASIYRGVQGLDLDDGQVELKREMMADIFQANLRLQERLLRKIG